MEAWFGELLGAFNAAKSMQDIFSVFVSATQSLGFEHCCYGVRSPLPVSRQQTYIYENYPDGWMARYKEKNYMAIDPTIAQGVVSQAPIIWSDALFARTPDLWDDAQDHGLCVGWAQSSWDKTGLSGLLSMSRGKEALSPLEIKDKYLYFNYLAQAGHATIVKNFCDQLIPDSLAPLTPREREVILWSAEGKTASEIGTILSLSERTVNFHIANIVKKLDCTNKMQAVVKAVILGLATPYY